jgi:hypothetical protein
LSFSSLLGFVLALHVFDGKLCCGGKERRRRGNEKAARQTLQTGTSGK